MTHKLHIVALFGDIMVNFFHFFKLVTENFKLTVSEENESVIT